MSNPGTAVQKPGPHPFPARCKKGERKTAALTVESVWGWGLDEGHTAAEWTRAMHEVEVEAVALAEAEARERELARREEEAAEAAEAEARRSHRRMMRALWGMSWILQWYEEGDEEEGEWESGMW